VGKFHPESVVHWGHLPDIRSHVGSEVSQITIIASKAAMSGVGSAWLESVTASLLDLLRRATLG
jgi:hypothetical protein